MLNEAVTTSDKQNEDAMFELFAKDENGEGVD
jgi:hypothetical protein